MEFKQWNDFNKIGEWTKEIDVRAFIQSNYNPYIGDASFLKNTTEKTRNLWNKVICKNMNKYCYNNSHQNNYRNTKKALKS